MCRTNDLYYYARGTREGNRAEFVWDEWDDGFVNVTVGRPVTIEYIGTEPYLGVWNMTWTD